MRETPSSISELININAYWFGLSFLWNGFHQLILPAVLLNFVNYQQKNTALGMLTFAGLLIAAIAQPVFGAISDRWHSSWGKRRPLILWGTLANYVFLGILAWSGGLEWIVIGYIGLQITSNVAQGAAQGLLPDLVPDHQLGVASGIKNLMDMAGLIAAMLILGRVFDPQAHHLGISVVLIGVSLALGSIVTLLGVHENSSMGVAQQKSSPARFQELPSANTDQIIAYTWLMASRFVFLYGVYGIQGFIQYYIRDVIHSANPISLTANLLSVIILALMVFAIVGGWLGDRISHQRILYIASFFGATGSLLLVGARTTHELLIYGSILGAGIGLFLTSNWALANLLVPSDQAGKFLGLSNLATAGAGALSRLDGPFIDILNRAYPATFPGYKLLFVVGAIGIITSVFLLRRVRYQRGIYETARSVG